MYREWPFFRVTLDMLEMVFAKADPRISQFYVQALVDPALHPFSDELLAKFATTRDQLLAVVGHRGLLSESDTAVLKQKLALREPYVTPLNVLQVLCLRTLREFEKEGANGGGGGGAGDGAAASTGGALYKAADLLSRDGGVPGDKAPLLSAVEDTVIITMKGISAGMQNTG
jgi:phosphoenolpyruvate carboxylase